MTRRAPELSWLSTDVLANEKTEADTVASLENWIGMSAVNYLKRKKQPDAYRGALLLDYTHSYRVATDTPIFFQQQQPFTAMQLQYGQQFPLV